jgi:hypothetical protein
VTCGFASSRPALSRRPCAVGAETTRLRWTGARSRPRRGRNLPRSEDVQFVPMLTSLLAAQACFGKAFGRDRIAPHRPRWRRLILTPPSAGVRSPSASGPPSRLTSFISELASHEVPGFGAPALPSALGLEALASALAIARDHGVSAPAGGGDSCPAATATCWHTKCRDVAISTRTKAPKGLESCRRGGASSRGAFGECRSADLGCAIGTSVTSVPERSETFQVRERVTPPDRACTTGSGATGSGGWPGASVECRCASIGPALREGVALCHQPRSRAG